jgi:hypothetical protein
LFLFTHVQQSALPTHPQMKSKLLALLAIILGTVLFTIQLPTSSDISPLPGPTLHVRLRFNVRFAGDYFIQVVMPKVGNDLTLGPETLPCEFSFVISKDDLVVHSQNIGTMTRQSEFGWGNTQQYQAGDAFRLGHGDYAAIIQGGGTCVRWLQCAGQA